MVRKLVRLRSFKFVYEVGRCPEVRLRSFTNLSRPLGRVFWGDSRSQTVKMPRENRAARRTKHKTTRDQRNLAICSWTTAKYEDSAADATATCGDAEFVYVRLPM